MPIRNQKGGFNPINQVREMEKVSKGNIVLRIINYMHHQSIVYVDPES